MFLCADQVGGAPQQPPADHCSVNDFGVRQRGIVLINLTSRNTRETLLDPALRRVSLLAAMARHGVREDLAKLSRQVSALVTQDWPSTVVRHRVFKHHQHTGSISVARSSIILASERMAYSLGDQHGESGDSARGRCDGKERSLLRSRNFAQVDVFSPTPYLGNPVAVVLDGTGLDDAAMQRVARWTNLTETTFLLPPTASGADYRVRIYTPVGEVPFAGHPTLGSAHAWLEHGGIPHRENHVIQECEVGLVEVRRGDGVLSFAAPPTRRSGELDETYVAQIVQAFGITREQICAHQWVDNGPGWAVIQFATAEEVLRLEPDFTQIPTAMVGAIGAYPAGSRDAFELRTFAPGVSTFEDPICGSMNASVGQWLLRTGQVATGYTVSQGTRLGRTGQVTITIDDHGTVWCGGATTTCFRGTANL